MHLKQQIKGWHCSQNNSPYQKLMKPERNFLFKNSLISNFERGHNEKMSHWEDEVKLLEDKTSFLWYPIGKSPIWWSSNTYFHATQILCANLPFTECYWVSRSSFSLMQSMSIFNWATTTMNPWSKKSFSEIPFFLPISEVNMGWHPQMLLPFSCWQEKKVSLSYAFTIWLWVSGSLMAAERWPGSFGVWGSFLWDATMKQTVTI